MANLVKGRNVVVSMDISGTYYPVFCAKTAEFPIDQEVIETTTVNSTKQREYVPYRSSATLTVTGITTVDNSNGKVSVTYLMQQSVRSAVQSLKITMTADNGTDLVITFNAIIRRPSFSRDVNGYSQSSVEFLATGPIGFDEVITPPTPPDCEIEDPLYIDVVAGENSVSSALLQATGVEILTVARAGVVHSYTSGTPVDQEFTTDLPNGDIIFSSLLPFNTGEVIYILYKIN